MPVAISPIDGQANPVPGQFGLEVRDELPVLVVDRALAPELVVVFRHFQDALARHVLATQDILEERHYFFGPLRTPEGSDQNRVVVHISPGSASRKVMRSLSTI